MNLTEYKKLKWESVSDLKGSSALDVMVHSIFVCLVIVANRVFYRRCSSPTYSWLLCFLANFLTLSTPFILGVTFLANHLPHVCLVLTIFIAVCTFWPYPIKSNRASFWNADAASCLSNALTDNRFVLFYGTTICILAVDFTIFPRHLAKTELYGFSVMDVGVGLFGFYYGLLSQEVRRPTRFGDLNNFAKSLKTIIPLLLIAFGRLIAVKMSDYPEHVTEYGVHWNFFFTLSFVRLGVSFVILIFPNPRYVGFIGLVLFSLYSGFIYMNPSFADWLINTPLDRRHLSLVDQNKEGIVSLPGFILIYLFAMQVGDFLSPLLFKATKTKLTVKLIVRYLAKMIFGALLSAVFAFTAHTYIQPCSRRVANFAYIFWLLFNFIMMLSICLLGTLLTIFVDFKNKKPKEDKERFDLILLPRAFNSNVLFLFLLSNIFTGLINISVQTLLVAPLTAFAIIVLYCFVVSFIAAVTYSRKIALKMW